MNNQSPEAQLLISDGSLEVFNIFKTIQGEGPYAGRPAIFIRLAGCNLQCPGCDTDYTTHRKTMTPETLLSRVNQFSPRPVLIVITGGEPFRQNISVFARLAVHADYLVQVETNGVYAPPAHLPGTVRIVVSPKAHRVHPETAKRAMAYKYVMKAGSVNPSDGLPIQALDHKVRGKVARPPDVWTGTIYLQPMDEQSDEANTANLEACVDSCLEHGYSLQLQIHKIIGVD